MNQNLSKGFMFVASFSKPYFDAAIQAADSIKDYWPEAKIALYTHEEWWDEKYRNIFDHVHLGVPVHVRAKLWALSKTPYDLTAYIDADTYCQSDEIRYLFDELDDETDMIMSCNRPYNAKVVYITPEQELTHYKPEDLELIKTAKTHQWDFEGPAGCWRMKWHCGMFVYRKNEHTMKMLDMWYNNYRTQIESNPKTTWPYKWPSSLWYWDTFAFFNTNYDTNYGVTIKEIRAKWNFVKGYREDRELKDDEEVIIYHYTIPNDLCDRSTLNDTNISNRIGDFKLIR